MTMMMGIISLVEETAANQLKKPGVNANDNKASVGFGLFEICL
jgi:hypothetical protein